MLRFDYHIHTELSRDSDSTVEEIVSAASEKGLDAIAITDHDGVEKGLEASGVSEDVVVVPGVEVTTRQGHLIGLGVRENIEQGLDSWETAEKIRSLGGTVVVPHPFQFLRHGIDRKSLERIKPDCIETWNSRYFTGLRNRQAVRYAERKGIPAVAGSDAHSPDMVGKAYTLVDAEPEEEEILEALEDGRTEVSRGRTPVWKYVWQVFSSAGSRF